MQNQGYLRYYVEFSQAEREEWDRIVSGSRTSWLYNTTGFIEHTDWYNIHYQKNADYVNCTFGLYDSEHNLAAGATVYRLSPDRVKTGLSDIFFRGKRPILGAQDAIFKNIDYLCEKLQVVFCTVQYSMMSDFYFKGTLQENNPLLLYDYYYALHYSQEKMNAKHRVIYLQKPLDVIRQELGQKCRNSINKSLRQGLDFSIGNSDEFISQYASVKSGPSHTIQCITNMRDNIGKACQIAVVSHKGKPISVSIYHCYKNKMLYWSNGSLKEYAHMNPNNFSMWKAIEWGAANGYEMLNIGNYYDSPIDNQKEYTVGRYKESFGKDYVIPYYGTKVYLGQEEK